MSDWTPGPWGVEVTCRHLWIGPMRRDGMKVDIIVTGIDYDSWYDDASRKERLANAQLIAAAPKLYEMLDRLVTDYGDVPDDPDGLTVMEDARAALAQAVSP